MFTGAQFTRSHPTGFIDHPSFSRNNLSLINGILVSNMEGLLKYSRFTHTYMVTLLLIIYRFDISCSHIIILN